jgi:hypothetical protein
MVIELTHPPEEHTASVGQLIANGTQDARTAALLWLAAEHAASALVVARPRLAGKTTNLNAFLRFTRPGTTFRVIQGSDDPYDPRSESPSPLRYVLCNEFSPAPVPTYVWGPKVRQVFEAAALGHPIAATMHAESLEEVTRLLSAPPCAVPLELLAHLDLFLFIRVLPQPDGSVLRRVAEVRAIRGVGANGQLQSERLVAWDQDHDRFEHTRSSDVLRRLVTDHGADVREEIERRARVLEGAVRQGILEGPAWAAVIESYRADPEQALARYGA